MGSGLYAMLLGPAAVALAIDSESWNQYAIESLVEVCPMEVYLTRRDGTVATHGVDLTNATGVDALVADFEERYVAEVGEPRLAAELLEGMRTSFFDCAWAQWTGGRVDAPAERGSVEPFADGCVPFLTAFAENPGERTGGYRPLFSPHAQCAFPRQLFFHYNAGDTFWFEKDGPLPWNMCNSVSWWLARFLGDWARHGGPPGVVLDVGANVGQESVLAASFGHSVVAYEPFPDTLATAAFNAAANCVRGVTLRPFGTSDGAGARCAAAADLHSTGSHAGDGVFRDRVVASQRVLAGDAPDGVCLNVTTLDAERAAGFVPRERAIVLKIDNEGSEPATLRGARRLLEEAPPLVVILEWLPFHYDDGAAADLAADLGAHGYTLYPLAPHDRSLRPPPYGYRAHDVLGEGLPLRRAGGSPVAPMDDRLWATMLDVLCVHRDLAAPGAGAALARDWGRAKGR